MRGYLAGAVLLVAVLIFGYFGLIHFWYVYQWPRWPILLNNRNLIEEPVHWLWKDVLRVSFDRRPKPMGVIVDWYFPLPLGVKTYGIYGKVLVYKLDQGVAEGKGIMTVALSGYGARTAKIDNQSRLYNFARVKSVTAEDWSLPNPNTLKEGDWVILTWIFNQDQVASRSPIEGLEVAEWVWQNEPVNSILRIMPAEYAN